MKLLSFEINNYKSLRSVQLIPSDMTVIIGANGSGKSNLSSSFDFIADIYANGIDFAVAKKGGFENIAFRRQRRTKSAVTFVIKAEFEKAEARRAVSRSFVLRSISAARVRAISFEHKISLRASKQAISADYYVEDELIELVIGLNQPESSRDPDVITITLRKNDGKVSFQSSNAEIGDRFKEYLRLVGDPSEQIANTEGDESYVRVFFPAIATALSGISVFQFSPQICRTPGAPSPNPRLSGYGQNLPSLIDWLSRKHPAKWESVVSSMRSIVPTLESISTQYLHTKTLGLVFQEEGFNRPWTAEDVSDGTIQSLAILVSLADPRNDLMFIEEPENSVHPWIVRQLANQLKKISKQKQVFVTTHSPVILNLVSPNDVWVCFKINGETSIRNLTEIGPEIIHDWENGQGRLFDLLDLGIVDEAVPSGR
ncbi:AAA family ATPase [Polaromonas sp. YR568]|uniref:AAA family ATPase n=1 Tax=Polaromonas sp. YR568 TaxID=1855301 RepID=UPI003137AA22